MDPFVDMCNGRSVIITHILLWYFRQATNVEIIAAIFNEYKIITSFRCSLCGREELKEEPYCHCGARMGKEAEHEVSE